MPVGTGRAERQISPDDQKSAIEQALSGQEGDQSIDADMLTSKDEPQLLKGALTAPTGQFSGP